MKFRPLHDRVVIERIEAEAKSTGVPPVMWLEFGVARSPVT